jgi:hypothetical protein
LAGCFLFTLPILRGIGATSHLFFSLADTAYGMAVILFSLSFGTKDPSTHQVG